MPSVILVIAGSSKFSWIQEFKLKANIASDIAKMNFVNILNFLIIQIFKNHNVDYLTLFLQGHELTIAM